MHKKDSKKSRKWAEVEWWAGVWMMIVLVGGVGVLLREYNHKPSVSVAYAIDSVAYIPQRVMIPKIGLVSALIPQPIVENDWLISETEVNYLVGSGSLNEGNVVLYAHREPGLFGRLHTLRVGDRITVTGSGESSAHYEVVESYSTTVENVEILKPTSEMMLTMFTCDGWYDEKRWVIRAVKVDDEEETT